MKLLLIFVALVMLASAQKYRKTKKRSNILVDVGAITTPTADTMSVCWMGEEYENGANLYPAVLEDPPVISSDVVQDGCVYTLIIIAIDSSGNFTLLLLDTNISDLADYENADVLYEWSPPAITPGETLNIGGLLYKQGGDIECTSEIDTENFDLDDTLETLGLCAADVVSSFYFTTSIPSQDELCR